MIDHDRTDHVKKADHSVGIAAVLLAGLVLIAVLSGWDAGGSSSGSDAPRVCYGHEAIEC